jgi:hypothetical protein
MRNREATLRKLEGVESNLTKLNFALRQGNRELYDDIIINIQEQISQLKLYVESEPMTGNEMNRV